MSLQRNIVASFASQIYVTGIGIVMLPLYIRYMGAEAYGLVGFFAMLQAWFSLLDIGLTPTIARQSARFGGGAVDTLSYRRLVRALEVIFLAVALLGAAAMLGASTYIASDWLRASQLPPEEVLTSVQLMAPIIAMRWMAGLYRGAIGGFERLVWLGGFNAVIATLRFGGVLPMLLYVGTSPTLFFSFQLGVAVVEFLVLLAYAYRLFPSIPTGTRLPWNWTPLKPLLKFSLTIAFTSSVGVLLVQTDKLVLSTILPLAQYGYFSMAVLVASGVMMLTGPVSVSILPRLVKLESQGDHAGLIRVYRRTTQLVSVLAGTASITMAFCAEPLLWAWTGERQLAQQAAPILALYALGNGFFSVAAFPYYLQFAKGDLRLHVIGNLAFLILLTPSMLWAASRHGSVGAGYVWLGMNLLALVAWLPIVHNKFAPGLNTVWYRRDVGIIFATISVFGFCGSFLLPQTDSRFVQIAQIIAYATVLLISGAIASSEVRDRFRTGFTFYPKVKS